MRVLAERRGTSSRPSDRAEEEARVRDEAVTLLSLRELIQQLIGNSAALVDKQVELAKSEARQEAKRRGIAMALLLGGLLFFLLALISILVAIILALALLMPGWLAALIVALVLAIAGGVLSLVGSRRVREPLMQKTLTTLKENVEWIKTRSSSNES